MKKKKNQTNLITSSKTFMYNFVKLISIFPHLYFNMLTKLLKFIHSIRFHFVRVQFLNVVQLGYFPSL